MPDTQEMSSSTKLARRAMWAILILAALFPVITTWNSTAFDTARFVGGLVMSVFLVYVVASVVFRKSSDDFKIMGSLGISLLVLLYSVVSTALLVKEQSTLRQAANNYSATMASTDTKVVLSAALAGSVVAGQTKPAAPSPSHKPAKSANEIVANVLNQMASIRQQQANKLAAFNERFGKINLEGALTPNSLVNPLSIAASRATLNEFGKLISERDALFSFFAKEGEAVLLSSEFQPADKTKALQVFQGNWVAQKKLLDDLSLAQRNVITATSKILNLAESNLGTLVVKDGNILFRTQEQLGVYQAQMARIAQNAQTEEMVTLELRKLAQEVQRNVEKDLKAMQK